MRPSVTIDHCEVAGSMCPPDVAGVKPTCEVPSPVTEFSSGLLPPGRFPLLIDGLLTDSVVPSTLIVHFSLLSKNPLAAA